jgi:hypothetical protein
MLRVSSSAVAAESPLSAYAIRFIAGSLGCRLRLVPPGEPADLHYGDGACDAPVRIPHWPECFDPAERHAPSGEGRQMRWVPVRRRGEADVDLIGGIGRLLCLLDEATVPESARGEDGVFHLTALDHERAAVHDVPLVDWHVRAVASLLMESGFDLAAATPRWPNGAQYAVVLTHDTDAAGLHDPRELARIVARGVRYRSPRVLAVAGSGAWGWITRASDPQFQFAGWAELERSLGVRSAFYLHTGNGGRRHLHDPTYAVGGHRRWRVLAELADDGWEMGIHAAIRSGRSTDALARSRLALEKVVGRPVQGLRHHYWRINWRAPWETFRRHEAAGYRYDTSMAWRDRPGFRAGTSQPYHPFDPRSGREVRLLELPTSIMDGHLFEYLRLDVAHAVATALELVGEVRAAGGLLNLNWHQETFANRHANRGWRDSYEAIVRAVAADSGAWVATPSDVTGWWLERERLLTD